MKKSATDAGNKAFIVNRIGDFGFSLAMFLIFGELRHARFRHGVRQMPPAAAVGHLLTAIACCCWSARAENRRRFRCTSGCRTPWKAPRRSAR
jgi:NADH:ubiquinone oxidoreductase subunit 5 (subunit L)/multisubunit Na+/H+ antiporter MnhA subunit